MSLPPEKAGFLTKRGHIRKNWKKRYFLLHGDGMLEYQTANKVRKGMIPLHEYAVQQATPMDLKTKTVQNVIYLAPQQLDTRPYFLSTKDEEEMKDWLTILQFASNEAKKRFRLSRAESELPAKKGITIKYHSDETPKSSTEFSNTRRSQSLKDTRRFIVDEKIRSFSLVGAIRPTNCNTTHLDKSFSIAIIGEGPVAPILIRSLLQLECQVRLIVVQNVCDSEDLSPSKWISKEVLDKLQVFNVKDAESALCGCSKLFLPNSININTIGISDLFRTAKSYDVGIVKVSLCGFSNHEKINLANQQLQVCLEDLEIPFNFVFPALPYECILQFNSFAGFSEDPVINLPFSPDSPISFVSVLDITSVCLSLLIKQEEFEGNNSETNKTNEEAAIGVNLEQNKNIVISGSCLTLQKIVSSLNSISPIETTFSLDPTAQKEPTGDRWLGVFEELLGELAQGGCSLRVENNSTLGEFVPMNPISFEEFVSQLM